MLDLKNIIGKKAIVRCYGAGVHYGIVEQVDEKSVILNNSRRIWYWSGAASLTQLAKEGVKNPDNCKFSVTLPTPLLLSDMLEILICTDQAIKIIEEVGDWKK